MIKKYNKKHTSNTPALRDSVFECGKPKHVAQFNKSKKAIKNFIRILISKVNG